MGGSAGAGDDDAQSTRSSRLSVLDHLLRHAMGGDDVDPMRDIELIEGRRGRLHRRPV